MDSLYIHPICVMEEAAIIDFNFVWLIPNEDPTKAFKPQIMDIIKIFVLFSRNVKIDKGANFCQVVKIPQDIQDKEDITDGNQKWYGTIPNLINIDDINININILFIGEVFHIEVDDIKRILDPSAWARKYFSMASLSWNLLDIFINGINDSILISRADHVNNQLFLDIAIKDLMIITEYSIFVAGDNLVDIKIQWNWTIKFKVRSFNFHQKSFIN